MNDKNPTTSDKVIKTTLCETAEISTGITERKIGGATYVVNSIFDENAGEGLLDKLWRLIKNDAG